jgi:hypothetical protein
MLFLAALAVGVLLVPIRASIVRRQQASELGELTGSTVDLIRPQPSAGAWLGLPAPPPVVSSWTGGSNVPGPWGRINATFPLAVLEVAPERLTLRLRPRIVARLVGAPGLTATPADVDVIFPVKGWANGGVGLVRHGSPVVYFFTRQRAAILNALGAAGFRVSPHERRYRS